ncbi:MAG TPA: hypothetical protein VHS76_00640 [Steroidobacteraceae bacterium]|jgi:hypothetical protein|nr:hypothetical protein [Steroidobacteraceae bacterium]
MRSITPEIVADELELQLRAVPPAMRPKFAEAIARFATKYVDEERSRCRILCKRRAELWRNTRGAASPLGAEEARSRANEADYLADLIVVDQPFETSP